MNLCIYFFIFFAIYIYLFYFARKNKTLLSELNGEIKEKSIKSDLD